MTDERSVKAITCPNCGASLDPAQLTAAHAQCTYCGTTLQLPKKEPEGFQVSFQVDQVELPRTVVIPPVRQPAKMSGGLSALVSAIILITIVVSICLPLSLAFVPMLIVVPMLAPLFSFLPFSWGYSNISQAYVLPAITAQASPDLLVNARESSSGKYGYALFDATGKYLWKSEPLAKDSYSSLPYAAGSQVFILDKLNLLALERTSGKTLWRKTLEFDVQSGCQECILASGGTLALLLKDGTVLGVAAADGSTLWSKKFTERPRWLAPAGEGILVADRDEKTRSQYLVVLDAKTGAESRRVSPTCPAERSTSNPQEFFPTGDGRSVLVFYYTGSSGLGNCAQLWDLTSSKQVWQSYTKIEGWRSSWSTDKDILLAGGSLYFTDTSNLGVMALDLKDGAVRQVFLQKGYRIHPAAILNGVLAVYAENEADPERVELWGIDLKSGARLWQYKYAAKGSNHISAAAVLSGETAGFGLVQCLKAQEDKYECRYERLNPVSGAAAVKTAFSTNTEYMKTTWLTDTAYVQSSPSLYALDLLTGKVRFKKP